MSSLVQPNTEWKNRLVFSGCRDHTKDYRLCDDCRQRGQDCRSKLPAKRDWGMWRMWRYTIVAVIPCVIPKIQAGELLQPPQDVSKRPAKRQRRRIHLTASSTVSNPYIFKAGGVEKCTDEELIILMIAASGGTAPGIKAYEVFAKLDKKGHSAASFRHTFCALVVKAKELQAKKPEV